MIDLPRPLVFTNGVFDILHLGHVRYLQQARALGASLVVGINDDESVKLQPKVIAGERILNNCAERREVLAALRCVDAVLTFSEMGPLTLMRELRPDVYCKGGDYDVPRLAESRVAVEWGCRVVTIPYVLGYSSRIYRSMLSR